VTARKRNKTRRLAMPIDLDGCVDILHYLECRGIQQEAVWCSTCKDHLPEEELCEHCWWCDTVGDYVTPDEGSVCFSADCWACSHRRRARHEAYRANKRMDRFRKAMEGAARMTDREQSQDQIDA
jgi:hypothetical protein